MGDDAAYLQFRGAKKDQHLPFDVEEWYPPLREYTFDTVQAELSPREAEAIVSYYQAKYNRRVKAFTAERAAALLELCGKVAALIDGFVRAPGEPVFVRLSNRSPKDGLKNADGVAAASARLYDEMVAAGHDATANTKMIATSKAQMRHLAVASADEAMSLLLSSERVFVDLQLALDCRARPGDVWRSSLFLRRWEPRLDDGLEFRCFVKNRTLCAISQYNHYCMFPHLQDPAEVARIQALIEAYYATSGVREAVPHDNCILDVALLPGPRLVVIEVNPYASSTGGALYCWKADAACLAAPPVEFRVRTEPMPRLDELLEAEAEMRGEDDADWRGFCNSVLGAGAPEKNKQCAVS